MSETYFIAREELARAFESPRAVRQFEQMQEQVATSSEVLTANVEATGALSEATFLTLSSNAELSNEYVLSVAAPLRFDVSDGKATLLVDAPIVAGGFRVSLTAVGTTDLVLPLTGALATLGNAETLTNKTIAAPLVTGLKDALDDAAAAAAGVPVNGAYRNGSVLMVRVA